MRMCVSVWVGECARARGARAARWPCEKGFNCSSGGLSGMWAPSRRRLEGVAFSFWVRGTWGHLRVLRCCLQGLSKAADGLTGSCLLHLGRLSRGLPAPSGDERGMSEQGMGEGRGARRKGWRWQGEGAGGGGGGPGGGGGRRPRRRSDRRTGVSHCHLELHPLARKRH